MCVTRVVRVCVCDKLSSSSWLVSFSHAMVRLLVACDASGYVAATMDIVSLLRPVRMRIEALLVDDASYGDHAVRAWARTHGVPVETVAWRADPDAVDMEALGCLVVVLWDGECTTTQRLLERARPTTRLLYVQTTRLTEGQAPDA